MKYLKTFQFRNCFTVFVHYLRKTLKIYLSGHKLQERPFNSSLNYKNLTFEMYEGATV